jgi:hypothetical protein
MSGRLGSVTDYVMTAGGRSFWVVEHQDGLAHMLGENPSLVSGAVHGGLGTLAGAGVGAIAGAVFFPAHVGLLALAGGAGLGAVASVHGYQVGERVGESIGLPDHEPTKLEMVGEKVHDVVTASTGSLVVDAAIGAGIGWVISPTVGWMIAGALLAGLGGVVGLGVLAGAYVVAQKME